MNYDEELQAIDQEMHDSEDALIAAGFPFEHWKLIRRYILATGSRNMALAGKVISDSVSSSDPTPKS